MKFIKIAILVIITSITFSFNVSANSVLNEILSSGTLKAGTTGDFNPFSTRDPATNKYQGYDIDVMSELAKDMGVEIDFVATDWKTIVNGVVAGKYHITGSASIKASRMKAAGFSDSYLAVVFKPFTTTDKLEKFSGWESINKDGVRIATTLGTANLTVTDTAKFTGSIAGDNYLLGAEIFFCNVLFNKHELNSCICIRNVRVGIYDM